MRTATHRYTGPAREPHGIPPGTTVRIVQSKGAAGGRLVEDLDGRRWLVGKAHLQPLEQPVTQDQRAQAQRRRWRRRRR